MKSFLEALGWGKMKGNEKLGTILMCAVALIIIANVFEAIFIPPRMMNCEEAKEELMRKQSIEDSEWKRLEDGKSPSMGAANVAIQDARADVEHLKNVVATTCRK